MGKLHEDNLPEVVEPPLPKIPDTSPEALSPEEAADPRAFGYDREKFHAVYDNVPKCPDDRIEGYGAVPASAITQGHPPWEALPDGSNVGEDTEKKILGMRRRVFYIFLGVVVAVIIAAAVGGGVGGAKAREGSGQPLPAESHSSLVPESSPTPSSNGNGTGTTTTSTPLPSPSFFLTNSTMPIKGFFKGYEGKNFSKRETREYRATGFYDLGFNATSYVWVPDGEECCVTFCANETTSGGYWCDKRYREEASAPFSRIFIWCGSFDGVMNGTCSPRPNPFLTSTSSTSSPSPTASLAPTRLKW